jgi:hypothetical protein
MWKLAWHLADLLSADADSKSARCHVSCVRLLVQSCRQSLLPASLTHAVQASRGRHVPYWIWPEALVQHALLAVAEFNDVAPKYINRKH